MLGSENLWTFGVDFAVANSDLIDSIHQLRDQIKIETGAAKSGYLSLRSDDHMRVFNRVIEVVPGHRHRTKLALRHWEFKKRIRLPAEWRGGLSVRSRQFLSYFAVSLLHLAAEKATNIGRSLLLLICPRG